MGLFSSTFNTSSGNVNISSSSGNNLAKRSQNIIPPAARTNPSLQGNTPDGLMSEATTLEDVTVRKMGPDVMICGVVRRADRPPASRRGTREA